MVEKVINNTSYVVINKTQHPQCDIKLAAEPLRMDGETLTFPVSPEVAALCIELDAMIKRGDIDIDDTKNWENMKIGELKVLIPSAISRWSHLDLGKQYDQSLDSDNEQERSILGEVARIIMITCIRLRLKPRR